MSMKQLFVTSVMLRFMQCVRINAVTQMATRFAPKSSSMMLDLLLQNMEQMLTDGVVLCLSVTIVLNQSNP